MKHKNGHTSKYTSLSVTS